MNALTPIKIKLPFGLTDENLDFRSLCSGQRPVSLIVPSDFDEALAEARGAFGEVFVIQRILTLALNQVPLRVDWEAGSTKGRLLSVATHPVVAVLISIDSVQHQTATVAEEAEFDGLLTSARKSLLQYRLQMDMFSDCQIVLCADSRGFSYPSDLYEADASLKSRADFEGLVQDILIGQLGNLSKASASLSYSSALGVIVAELFENTHIHGRFDLNGELLKPPALRGIIFKRIKFELPEAVLSNGKKTTTTQQKECLEISVFDTSVGYFPSFTGKPLSDETPLDFEWKVLHNCLQRHHDPELKDIRPSHRGMGLAEVFRALQALEGRIEIRTGRLFVQRTFMPGELLVQMKKISSPLAQRSQPIPTMLDYEKKYVGIPTAQDLIVGAAIRVIVPLG